MKTDHDIKVVKATIEDIQVIRDVQGSDGFVHAYSLTKERLERLFRRGEKFFIARLGTIPAGFASIDMEIRARVHFLSVRADMTKKGWAVRL